MTTTSSNDILELLKSDHRKAEQLLSQFEAVPVDSREEYFCEVVSELVGHEVAEELVVYPAIRQDASDGDLVAAPRIAEQSRAEDLLAEMEHLDTARPEFVTKFASLRDAVLKHASAEEATVFPLLNEVEDTTARAELGLRYQKAKGSAPTHPHPHMPDTPPGNKVIGPIAAVFDKARDAARGI